MKININEFKHKNEETVEEESVEAIASTEESDATGAQKELQPSDYLDETFSDGVGGNHQTINKKPRWLIGFSILIIIGFLSFIWLHQTRIKSKVNDAVENDAVTQQFVEDLSEYAED